MNERVILIWQGKGCEDVISTLRNGSAAENAFAVMQEKGLLLPRRSRHRLTPGTVKFAAFHVLSLEGSKGLTVLELADKIQVSFITVEVKFFFFLCKIYLPDLEYVVPFLPDILFFLATRNLDFGT